MPAFVKLGDIKASSTNHVVVQSESLILPTDGDDILVVKPEANDVLTGLDVGPVNKLADNGWWTVDGANFRDTQQDAQPEKESFGSFEPREAKLQEASTNDQLIGGKALKWSELCDVGLSLRKADDFIKLGDIKGEYQVNEFPGDLVTGQEISDGSLAYAGSLFGEGVFKPQSIEDKGSVIFGDNHFRTGDGDSLTGIDSDGPNYISEKGFITNQLEHGPSLHDSVHCIVGGTMCSFLGIDSELQTDDLRSENRFVIERFEPAAGMNSFGESLNPLLEIGSNSGPGCTTFMTGNIGFPNNNITGGAAPGGDDV